jgi:hypothetical protein
MEKIIKIVLSFLLFVCLLDMPYGYYQFVRFTALAAFAYLAYNALVKGNEVGMVLFIILALLFQPFVKIALGRELWNVVDVAVGLGLLATLFKVSQKSKDTKN